MSFSDDLKTPVERDWVDVDIVLSGNLHTLRFTALDGLTWANACDNHPMRPGVALDGAYGYDLRGLTIEAAALSGVLVDGDTTVPLVVEKVDPKHPDTAHVDEWAALFAKVDGQTFRRISDAIWVLNELIPQQAVEAAKKALAVSETPSSSPTDSESPLGGSSDGNPKKPSATSTSKTDD